MTRGWAVMAMLAGVVSAAAAEEPVTYEVSGRAADTLADARTSALDAAFASAIRAAVVTLAGTIPPAQIAEVDREIVARARRFVASFQVQKQSGGNGALELVVAVRVDHDKLRARLLELGLALHPVPAEVAAPRPRVALFVATAGPQVIRGDDVGALAKPVLRHFSEALDRAGFVVVAPPTDAEHDETELLPVDDPHARAAALAVNAQLAVIVGIRVALAGAVRGTPYQSAPAEAALRVVEVATGAVVDSLTVRAGAWGRPERIGSDAADAAALALTTAWSLGREPAPRSSRPEVVLAPRSGTFVRIHGDRIWSVVASLRAELATVPGVTRVAYAGISAGQIALEVSGSSVASVASVVRALESSGAHIAIDGRTMDVTLSGSP